MDNTAAPPSIGDMDAQFGSHASTQTLIPTQTEAPRTVTVDDMDAHFGNTQKTISAMGAAAKGFDLGVNEATSKPAEWLAKGAEKIGLTGTLNKLGIPAPTYAQQVAGDAADTATGENALIGNSQGQIGKLVGQTAVVAPLISTGGALAGTGATGLAAGLADSAPLASKIIQGGANLLSGTAGAGMDGVAGGFTRAISKAAQGGQIGGQAAAYTGQPIGTGTVYGAALGPAGAVAGKVLGAAVTVGKNMLSPLTDMSEAATQRAAVNKLVQAFQADGMTTAQAMAKASALGEQGMLADAGGANVRNAAETVANSPGAGSDIAQQALEARAGSQAGRVNQAVKDATGVTGNIHAEADQLMAQRAQDAAPLYDKALANPIIPNDKLSVQLQNPLIQAAMKDGAKIAETNAAANGETFDPKTYFNPDGSTPAAPTMKALDAAKQGLDDMLEKYRDPTTGKLNLDSRGRAINNLRASFVNNLDSLNPDYAAARAAYAGPSQSLDAMNMGKRALSNDPEVNAKIVGNLSDGDKQFYLQGVTRALQDKISGAQDGADVTRRIFGNDLIRNKIAAAFDDPAAFAKFQQQMEAESTFAQTRNQVLKGPQTARRLAGQADAAQPLADAGRQLLSGNLGSAITSGVKGFTNYLMQPSQAQSTALGNLLFKPGQAGTEQLQQALDKMQPGAARQLLNQLIQGGKGAALPAATLGTQQIYNH